jgi:hypothetical protein
VIFQNKFPLTQWFGVVTAAGSGFQFNCPTIYHSNVSLFAEMALD